MPIPRTRKSPPRKGLRTRTGILRAAVDLASVAGLDGLTIGRLADELQMSKSGLFAHFGSKQELQLATIAMAREIFADHVIRPALGAPEGVRRLLSLCTGWLNHVEDHVFEGGCFFTAASLEFDSRRGPVRDAIAESMKMWLGVLERAIEVAKKAKHLKASVDAEQLGFEIYSLAMGANWALHLLDDKTAISKARDNIARRIRSAASDSCPSFKSLK